MPSRDELKILQALSLDLKIRKTQQRIREAINRYGVDGMYVSFSGGKDSTVLLHIVRGLYPEVEAVFCDTGLEYPQVRKFAMSFDNVTMVRPEMRFDEVIREYGYPFIGKEAAERIQNARRCILGGGRSTLRTTTKLRKKYPIKVQQILGIGGFFSKLYDFSKWKPLINVDFLISPRCCNITKKAPLKKLHKVPFVATLAEESNLRTTDWLKHGCNAFDGKEPKSKPLSFWTEQDILQYIKENNLPIASVYGEVVEQGKNGQCCIEGCGKLCTTECDRTGCIFCAFGAHHDCDDGGESRFERLKKTHPRQYEYCMGGGSYQWDGYINLNGKWEQLSFKGNDGKSWGDKNIERFVEKHKNDKIYKFERLWKPTKDGLGMAHCIDVINKIYGKDFIKY